MNSPNGIPHGTLRVWKIRIERVYEFAAVELNEDDARKAAKRWMKSRQLAEGCRTSLAQQTIIGASLHLSVPDRGAAA